ncbi:MAG TPA: NADAR family protein [Ktedonobacterales bacterium]
MSDEKLDDSGQRPVIAFYGSREAYGAFSNFASYPIELDGLRWPAVEHYLQAQKFAGTPQVEAIRLAPSPMVAARMGRSRAQPLRSDSDQVKDEIMLRAVRAKFAQHADLAALLLSTGDALIVEHSRRDGYWGNGGDGSGANRFGQILMTLRAELRA